MYFCCQEVLTPFHQSKNVKCVGKRCRARVLFSLRINDYGNGLYKGCVLPRSCISFFLTRVIYLLWEVMMSWRLCWITGLIQDWRQPSTPWKFYRSLTNMTIPKFRGYYKDNSFEEMVVFKVFAATSSLFCG